jgi:5-methyltetrahydrofolate--homocysteine methyltransferase
MTQEPMSDCLKTLRERVIVYDGAMGTSVQVGQPSVDDFWGNEGCNEILGGQVFCGVGARP